MDEVPVELARLCQWVCWRQETRKGKPTKVPFQPERQSRQDERLADMGVVR